MSKQKFVPTQEEIRQACDELKSKWTPMQEMHRRGVRLARDDRSAVSWSMEVVDCKVHWSRVSSTKAVIG